jgi:hypothetical protein
VWLLLAAAGAVVVWRVSSRRNVPGAGASESNYGPASPGAQSYHTGHFLGGLVTSGGVPVGSAPAPAPAPQPKPVPRIIKALGIRARP